MRSCCSSPLEELLDHDNRCCVKRRYHILRGLLVETRCMRPACICSQHIGAPVQGSLTCAWATGAAFLLLMRAAWGSRS